MPLCTYVHAFCKRIPKQTLRIMKLTIAIFLVGLLHVSATGVSQITLVEKNSSLQKIFKQIQKQSGYDFVYNSELLLSAGKVDVEVRNATLEQALKACLKDKPLNFAIVEKTVVITPRPITAVAPPLVIDIPPAPPPPVDITGRISNDKGEPLQGVSVKLKGTDIGTTSGVDGGFTIRTPEARGTLVFSYVGYEIKEIAINNRTNIIVALALLDNSLDEVVFIGYGQQKKVNVTGSVAEMRSKDIENRPVTQLSQLFAGQLTGISATQASGEPGADQADILVRGRGTFSSAGIQPLVLIDGLPSSLNNIDPNSVESVSILKDAASAAIYGARAANGVILVTTKRGKKGRTNVQYNGYAGWVKPGTFPDYVSTAQYAEMYNEALVNGGSQPLYSPADIEKFTDDPVFSTVNHPKQLFTSGNGLQHSHNVSVSGGNDQTTYFASMVYLKQNGIIRRNDYDRFTFTLNLDQKIANKLKLGVNLVAITGKSDEPITTAGVFAATANVAESVRFLYQMANLLPPVFPGKYPNGDYGYDGSFNAPLAALDSKSNGTERQYNVVGSLNLEYAISPEFKLSGRLGTVFNQGHIRSFNATFRYTDAYFAGPAWLRETFSNETDITLQALAEYTKSFGKHSLYALAGYAQEANIITLNTMSRNGFPSNNTTVINAGSTATMQNTGTQNEWGLRSYFGRIQYSFDDRYLLETNLRYDGSSRFSKSRQYGFFPSFSGAWKIANEKFFKVGWVNDLKLRASWGNLGNQNIGNYSFQNILALGQDYVFGNGIQPGAALLNLANQAISWETTRIIDIGADISLLNRKLTLEVDYFNKKTTDILYNVPVSTVLGFTPPVLNAGAVLNKGWEFRLVYRNNIGSFNYSISPNFSSVQTEILELPTKAARIITLNASDYNTVMQRGIGMNAFYGYIADGLFVDQADVDKSPTQPTAAKPGDIKFRDISGPDGVPDGKVDPTYDRTVLGSYFPKYTFGADLSMSYKNFDFSVLFQGVAGVEGILSRWRAMPFNDGVGAIPSWMADRWTTDNPNPNAAQPRLLTNFRDVSNSFWVRDASYLRMKFLQVGYTIPPGTLAKFGMNRLRLYFSATNLFTISGYYKGYDPDQRLSTDSRYYPVGSTFTFGINAGL